MLLSLSLAAPASAQRFKDKEAAPRTNSQFLYAFRDATAEAMKSTVRVLGDKKDAALGTIVTADGFILTKYSEVANAKVVHANCRTARRWKRRLWALTINSIWRCSRSKRRI